MYPVSSIPYPASPSPPSSPIILDVDYGDLPMQSDSLDSILKQCVFQSMSNHMNIAGQINAIIKEIGSILQNSFDKIKSLNDIDANIILTKKTWKHGLLKWSATIEAYAFLKSDPSYFNPKTETFNLHAIKEGVDKLAAKVENYQVIAGIFRDIYLTPEFKYNTSQYIEEWIQEMNGRYLVDSRNKKVLTQLLNAKKNKFIPHPDLFHISS